MTLIERFAKTHMIVDFSQEILFGHDECLLYYPAVFPTVTFHLVDTLALCDMADSIRREAGFESKTSISRPGQEGFYIFRVGLNGFTKSMVDSCIEFTVVDMASGDNETTYSIDLTDEEQEKIFARLDEQCRAHLKKSCRDLLWEANALLNKRKDS